MYWLWVSEAVTLYSSGEACSPILALVLNYKAHPKLRSMNKKNLQRVQLENKQRVCEGNLIKAVFVQPGSCPFMVTIFWC